MCVAIAVPEGVAFPSVDTLEACEFTNDDGIGIAFPDGFGRVEYYKGLSLEELTDLASMSAGMPRLVHFRLATAGGVDPRLSHPFPLTKNAAPSLQGTAPRVLVHNGHWTEWDMVADLVGPLPSGPWSDTRLMARLIALHGDAWITRFVAEERVGKLATLDGEGNIGLAGDWEMVAGCYFSNTHWEWGNQGRRYGYKWPSDYKPDKPQPVTVTFDPDDSLSDDSVEEYVTEYLERTGGGTPEDYADAWESAPRSTRQERYTKPETE